MSIDPQEARYHRQMMLPGVGREGQARLGQSHVMIVGCGALGCVSADWLARAGVGTISLLDRDLVEATNLQRQTLYTEEDAGLRGDAGPLPKAEAAANRLQAVNRDITVKPIVADLQSRNAERLLGMARGEPPTLILDGTDNFATRFLLNDLACKHGIPWVYAGAVATRGTVMPVLPGRTACLRCVIETPPPPGTNETCDTAGVLGPAVGVAASLQTAEAIKILTGNIASVHDSLFSFDVWANTRGQLRANKPRSDCPCCQGKQFDFLDGKATGTATALCGQDAVQVWPASDVSIDLPMLAKRLASQTTFTTTEFLARGRVSASDGSASKDFELTVFADGRAIIRGTRDPAAARSIYARYIGI